MQERAQRNVVPQLNQAPTGARSQPEAWGIFRWPQIESGFDSVRVGRDTCRITGIRKVDYLLMKQEKREL